MYLEVFWKRAKAARRRFNDLGKFKCAFSVKLLSRGNKIFSRTCSQYLKSLKMGISLKIKTKTGGQHIIR